MARSREPADWERDLAAARPVERAVHAALAAHPQVSHLSDFTNELDVLDFRFRFEAEDVRLDAKAKFTRYSEEVAQQWAEVPRDELLILDETSFRELLWAEGMGYLLVRDEPRSRWHTFGPWELALGPRRRFERRGTKNGAEFLKGKLLLDLRTAAATSVDIDVDAVLDVVRRSRRALRHVRAIPVRTQGELPVIPTRAPATTRTEPAPLLTPPPRQEEAEADPAWAGLSAELSRTIQQRWGWNELTPAQRAAFPAILQRHNAVVIAPTAGGKTEAALLPLLDLHRELGWSNAAPSILVISPLKALLDDQLERWQAACGLVGATAFAWHGDVGPDDRRAFKDKPTDALLTTPESLELLLTSSSHDERALFGGIQAVLVDELHTFVGTARGAQLAALIERLFRIADDDFQRVGLSATLGDPEAALSWLSGGSMRERQVVTAVARMRGEDISVRTYSDDNEAFRVITEAVADHRALVFTRSRRRAEQVANLMSVPVHHSSISAEDRATAVAALRSGRTRCIVATGTLEAGIDIGDLDLIVHDGPPTSPGSYLQRVGRSGRKTGRRRVVFTVADADDLVLLLAVVARARRGDLGREDPQRGARLVLGQQAMAICLQEFIVDREALYETLRWSSTFAGLEADIGATIDHLVAEGFLRSDGDRLVLGPAGNTRFGGRQGVLDLLATFNSVAGAVVADESGRKIGTVDWTQVDERDGRASRGLVLSGRPWTIVRIDRLEGVVTVRPGERGRAPSWRGPSLEVDRATWEAVREVLDATEVPTELDERATQWLVDLRRSWHSRLENPVRAADEATVVDSFCGESVHRAALHALDLEGHAEGATCEISASPIVISTRAQALLSRFDAVLDAEAARVATQLQIRHRDLVAPAVLAAEARRFHVDASGLHRFLTMLASA